MTLLCIGSTLEAVISTWPLNDFDQIVHGGMENLSHILSYLTFQTTLPKAVAKYQNEVPFGKQHFCLLVQIWKQFSVLSHQTICGWRKVRPLSHMPSKWIFQTTPPKAVTKYQNEVPLGKWHFYALVKL